MKKQNLSMLYKRFTPQKQKRGEANGQPKNPTQPLTEDVPVCGKNA